MTYSKYRSIPRSSQCSADVRRNRSRSIVLVGVTVALVLLFGLAPAVRSQADTTKPQADSTRTRVKAEPPCDTCYTVISADTIVYVPPTAPTTAADVMNPKNFEEHLYQNPTVALFKSLLVPGWGQLGNRRYVKASVIVGLDAWFIGSAIHYGRQASDARDLYNEAVSVAARNNWHDFLDNKLKNRNKFIWFAGITTFISMFDAYVDAHLSGSPMDRKDSGSAPVSLNVVPNQDGWLATINYNF